MLLGLPRGVMQIESEVIVTESSAGHCWSGGQSEKVVIGCCPLSSLEASLVSLEVLIRDSDLCSHLAFMHPHTFVSSGIEGLQSGPPAWRWERPVYPTGW